MKTPRICWDSPHVGTAQGDSPLPKGLSLSRAVPLSFRLLIVFRLSGILFKIKYSFLAKNALVLAQKLLKKIMLFYIIKIYMRKIQKIKI